MIERKTKYEKIMLTVGENVKKSLMQHQNCCSVTTWDFVVPNSKKTEETSFLPSYLCVFSKGVSNA